MVINGHMKAKSRPMSIRREERPYYAYVVILVTFFRDTKLRLRRLCYIAPLVIQVQ